MSNNAAISIPLDLVLDRVNALVELAQPFDWEAPSKRKDCTDELRLLEGTFRKNLTRQSAILHLAGSESEDLSGPATEIMRNMIEDTVSIAYIYAEPAKSSALVERFFSFRWVQLEEDAKFYDSIGSLADETLRSIAENIAIKSQEAKALYHNEQTGFVRPHGIVSHSWIRKTIEQLLADLQKDATYPRNKVGVLLRAYINGSRQTHFNPQGTLSLLGDFPLHGRSPDVEMYQALILGALSLNELLQRYANVLASTTPWIDAERITLACDDLESQLLNFYANITSIE